MNHHCLCPLALIVSLLSSVLGVDICPSAERIYDETGNHIKQYHEIEECHIPIPKSVKTGNFFENPPFKELWRYYIANPCPGDQKLVTSLYAGKKLPAHNGGTTGRYFKCAPVPECNKHNMDKVCVATPQSDKQVFAKEKRMSCQTVNRIEKIWFNRETKKEERIWQSWTGNSYKYYTKCKPDRDPVKCGNRGTYPKTWIDEDIPCVTNCVSDAKDVPNCNNPQWGGGYMVSVGPFGTELDVHKWCFYRRCQSPKAKLMYEQDINNKKNCVCGEQCDVSENSQKCDSRCIGFDKRNFEETKQVCKTSARKLEYIGYCVPHVDSSEHSTKVVQGFIAICGRIDQKMRKKLQEQENMKLIKETEEIVDYIKKLGDEDKQIRKELKRPQVERKKMEIERLGGRGIPKSNNVDDVLNELSLSRSSISGRNKNDAPLPVTDAKMIDYNEYNPEMEDDYFDQYKAGNVIGMDWIKIQGVFMIIFAMTIVCICGLVGSIIGCFAGKILKSYK